MSIYVNTSKTRSGKRYLKSKGMKMSVPVSSAPVKAVATQALKIAKRANRAIKPEYKTIYDLFINGEPTDSLGTVYNSLSPTIGLGANQITGNKCRYTYLQIRGEVWQPIPTQGGTEIIDRDAVARIIVYIDRDNNISTAANLLAEVNFAGAVYSPRNPSYKARAKILYDKAINFTFAKTSQLFKFNKKFKGAGLLHQTDNNGNYKNVIKVCILSQANHSNQDEIDGSPHFDVYGSVWFTDE